MGGEIKWKVEGKQKVGNRTEWGKGTTGGKKKSKGGGREGTPLILLTPPHIL